MVTPTKKAPAKLTRKVAAPNGVSKEAAARGTAKAAAATDKLVSGAKSRKNVAILEGLLAMTPAERNTALDELARTELAEKFVALRTERGLSQRELGLVYGGLQGDISKVENATPVSIASMQRVARALGAKLVVTLER